MKAWLKQTCIILLWGLNRGTFCCFLVVNVRNIDRSVILGDVLGTFRTSKQDRLAFYSLFNPIIRAGAMLSPNKNPHQQSTYLKRLIYQIIYAGAKLVTCGISSLRMSGNMKRLSFAGNRSTQLFCTVWNTSVQDDF